MRRGPPRSNGRSTPARATAREDPKADGVCRAAPGGLPSSRPRSSLGSGGAATPKADLVTGDQVSRCELKAPTNRADNLEHQGLTKHDLVSAEEGHVDDAPRRRRRSRAKAVAAVATALSLLAVPALADADVGVVNAQRAGAGLPPVVEDGGLAGLAQRQAVQMATTGNLAHSGNLGGAVGTVLPSYTGAAENVGQGASVASVSNLFMGSPTHRSAILGNYDTAGVGVARSSDGRVWVAQVFARTGGRVLSNTVSRPAAPRPAVTRRPAVRSACRTQTRRVTRRVGGRRVTSMVRARVCTKAKRKVTRKRSARRAVRSSSRR